MIKELNNGLIKNFFLTLIYYPDVSNLDFNLFGLTPKTKIAIKRSVHEQDDGTIYGICATGSSTKDSLLSWIRHLERDNNPCLAKIPIVFKFRSPVANQLVPVTK